MDNETRKEISALWDKINELSKQLSDFTSMLNEQKSADIDFIAMETGVELEQEDEEIIAGD